MANRKYLEVTKNWRTLFTIEQLEKAQRIVRKGQVSDLSVYENEVSATVQTAPQYIYFPLIKNPPSRYEEDWDAEFFFCDCTLAKPRKNAYGRVIKRATCSHEAALLMAWEMVHGPWVFRETDEAWEERQKQEQLIRGAGSLMGAEQHGNLSSVGFDLFTQMLGQAVAEARGEAGEGDLAQSEVTVNLPADFFLAEEYLPDVDRRVLAYRRLAGAVELSEVDALQMELEERYGGMPLAARNLFDRARVRIRAERLGVTSVSLVSGRLIYQGVELPRELAQRFRSRHAIYYPKTGKLTYPFHRGEEEVMPAALGVLEEIGGHDEADEE